MVIDEGIHPLRLLCLNISATLPVVVSSNIPLKPYLFLDPASKGIITLHEKDKESFYNVNAYKILQFTTPEPSVQESPALPLAVHIHP
jgi:hypothetical protein